MGPLAAVRLADLQIFAAAARIGSCSVTARMLDVTPAQVASAIARLGEQLASELVAHARNGDALELTDAGKRASPIIEAILERAQHLRLDVGLDGARAATKRVTVAACSFVHEHVLPRLAATSDIAIRAVAVPSSSLPRCAVSGLVDAMVTIGGQGELPPSWTSEPVGEIRYGLFGSPETRNRFGHDVHAEDVRQTPFVVPVYLSDTGTLTMGEDGCPLSRRERRIAHEVETFALACRIASETENLVYGPVLTAAPLVAMGRLVELHVEGWSRVEPLHLASDGTSVPASVHATLAATICSIFGASPVRVSGIVPVVASSTPPAERRTSTR